MAVTYLKGAGAAIGRGAEAFEAQQGQHAESASDLEAAMQTSRYYLTVITITVAVIVTFDLPVLGANVMFATVLYQTHWVRSGQGLACVALCWLG